MSEPKDPLQTWLNADPNRSAKDGFDTAFKTRLEDVQQHEQNQLSALLQEEMDQVASAAFHTQFQQGLDQIRQAEIAQLQSLLHSDSDQEASLGFDTRFKARLREVQSQERRYFYGRWWFAGSAALLSAAMLTLWLGPIFDMNTHPSLSTEQMAMMMDYELYANYEIAQHWDTLNANAQDLAWLENLNDQDFESLLQHIEESEP